MQTPIKRAVVALGGNAISMRDREDTIANQFENTLISLDTIIGLIQEEYQLAITHGNGPQVGNAILRVELAKGRAPILPLFICVADLQGGMGYMIEQCLQNRLIKERITRRLTTIVTQVLVDKNDPAFINPTKFIGQFYRRDIAEKIAEEMGWSKDPKIPVIRQYPGDPQKRWRRVVPSPKPLEIIEKETIRKLVESDTVVIAAGGGGIPVLRDNKLLQGVDAVIDKDLASAVLAHDIGAELLMILTDVERVAVNYGTPEQQNLDDVTVERLIEYRNHGQFPAGSMGPKVDAAINFIKGGGKKVIITSIDKGHEAVLGQAGTHIVS